MGLSPHQPLCSHLGFLPLRVLKSFVTIFCIWGCCHWVFVICVYVRVMGHGCHLEIDIKEFDVERQ